jgi:hypothetical protein
VSCLPSRRLDDSTYILEKQMMTNRGTGSFTSRPIGWWIESSRVVKSCTIGWVWSLITQDVLSDLDTLGKHGVGMISIQRTKSRRVGIVVVPAGKLKGALTGTGG